MSRDLADLPLVCDLPPQPGMTNTRAAAALVTALASATAAAQPAPAIETTTTVARAPESPTTFARAELISWQTINGLMAGVDVCLMTECDTARETVGFLMLGTAIGFGGSLLASRDGVTPGTTALVNSGTTYGALNGGLLAAALDADDDGEVGAALLAGQLVGTGVGALLASRFEPTGGQVALATTVGSWAGGAMVLVNRIADTEDHGKLFGSIMAAMNVGLIGGAFLADGVEISRGRVLLINTGGSLGLLLGAGVDVLIEGDDVSQSAIMTSMLIGAGAGLALTTWLTRNWDAPSNARRTPSPQARLSPVWWISSRTTKPCRAIAVSARHEVPSCW